jgi:hypothetical protein
VQVRDGQQESLQSKLEKIRRNGLHTFPGTVARYIVGYQEKPDQIEIMLIWKTGAAPEEAEREKALEAFRQELADVLDWSTAEYEHGTAFMHT